MKTDNLFKAIGNIDDELLERSENNIKSKNNLYWARWLPITVSFCLIIVGVVLLIDSNNAQPKESSTNSFVNVHVNELCTQPSFTISEIFLLKDDYIVMTDDEFMTYFGLRLPGEIISGLTLQKQNSNGNNGIYKNNIRGAYYDTHSFHYSNANGSQGITIILSKGRLPRRIIWEPVFPPFLNSDVNGIAVTIAHYMGVYDFSGKDENNDIYYAEFMLKGNGYAVISKNMSAPNFMAALTIIVG
jgi:hypothetical protein